MTTTITDIPSLSEAYAAKDSPLRGIADDEQLYKPSKSINDRVSLWQGDITKLQVDGIQNAANSGLRGGGGIDGAIHRAAGPGLLKACKELGGCETGNTKVTTAFDLPSQFVLHTVGPVYSSSKKEACQEQLASCYATTLDLAKENGMKSLALCGVSTGVYGFPLRHATEIALKTTREFLEDNEEAFERIVFCNFGQKDVDVYTELAPYYFQKEQ